MQKVATVVLFAVTCPSAIAQIGGNGSDGAFVPDKDTVIDTRWKAGKFNFTKIVIPKGVTVTVVGPNPAILYSTGDVRIDGTLAADGNGQQGGPGGDSGGPLAKNGGGPGGGEGGPCLGKQRPGGGGGHATKGSNSSGGQLGSLGGKPHGSVLPFDGSTGSGGGGGCNGSSTKGGVGGGGGGSLAIMVDGSVTIPGVVSANGGQGAGPNVGGGGGAGGKILIRSLGPISIGSRGSIEAVGGAGGNNGGAGGLGYLRLDTYGSRPSSSSRTQPPAEKLRLPDLDRTTEPKIGTTMNLRVVSLPGDTVLLAVAAKGADILFPPFGTLKLDPGTMLIYGIKKTTSGLDGIATFDVPIPNNTQLLGVMVHWQALNTVTVSRRPLLTNVLIITTLK